MVDQQKFQKASIIYETVVESTTDSRIKIRVLVQLAQLYAFHLNRVEESIVLIERAIWLNKDPSKLIKFKEIFGDIYFTKLRNFKKSSEIYDELIKVKPELPQYSEYKYRYAESLFFSNKLREAISVFNSLLETTKDNNISKILYRTGLINYLLGESDKAIEIFRKVIDGDFKYTYKVKSSFFLAGLYEDLDQLDNSLKYYNLIRYDYPNPRLVKQKMESIYRKKLETGL